QLIGKAVIRIWESPWRRRVPVGDRRDLPVGVVGQRETAATGVRYSRQQRSRIRQSHRVSVGILDSLQEAGRAVEKELDLLLAGQLQLRSDLLQGGGDSFVRWRVGAALIDKQVIAAVAPLNNDVQAGEKTFDLVIGPPTEPEGAGKTALVSVVRQFKFERNAAPGNLQVRPRKE